MTLCGQLLVAMRWKESTVYLQDVGFSFDDSLRFKVSTALLGVTLYFLAINFRTVFIQGVTRPTWTYLVVCLSGGVDSLGTTRQRYHRTRRKESIPR
jgi:hypothetical protein